LKIGIDASALRVHAGGIQRYTDQLLRALARVDDENEYVLYGAPDDLDGSDDSDGSGGSDEESSYSLPARFNRDRRRLPFKHWLDSLFLVDSNHELDLFHGTNYWAPLVHRFPSVLTVHDLTVRLFPHSHPFRRRMMHRLLPTLCRGARRIIADSHNTRRDLERCYGVAEDRVDVIYLAAGEEFRAIDDQGLLSRVRAHYGLPERFVLFVGSLEPRKNLPMLIRALAALQGEAPTLRLVIAGRGDPSYVAMLGAEIARAGLTPGREVIFTGFVPDAELPALYNLCEFFVYPSVYEGFGLPPLEAMGCGKPVIVSDNSCLSEVYQGAALLCPIDSADALVESMRLLLDAQTLREELVERGRKLATSRSWDDTARETLAVYQRAAQAA